jgi:hypothetical protein
LKWFSAFLPEELLRFSAFLPEELLRLSAFLPEEFRVKFHFARRIFQKTAL